VQDFTLTTFLPSSPRRHNRQIINQRVAWLSEAYLLAGRQDEALTQARLALDFARAHRADGDRAYLLRILGDIHLHDDPPDVEPARDHFRQDLALAEQLGMRPLIAHCRFNLSTLHRRIGRREQAYAELFMAIELYRAMAMPFWLSRAQAELARAE
jgi:tetratricopeptide (TPR) repeat protein